MTTTPATIGPSAEVVPPAWDAPGTRLLLTADTHLPTRATALPPVLLTQLAAADVVVHAGDWVDEATLDLFEDTCSRLVAVHGNNDGAGLRARLPEVARVDIEGISTTVVHETGAATGREARMDQEYATDLLVFGHSHIPWDTTTAAGMRLLNPGSPTDRRRQPHCTWLTARVHDGRLHDLELQRLARRG